MNINFPRIKRVVGNLDDWDYPENFCVSNAIASRNLIGFPYLSFHLPIEKVTPIKL